MKCPLDGTELKMSERQGIEIDYCPKCRGVWLDRGELDKIIDRAAADLASFENVPLETATEGTSSSSPVGGLSHPMRDTSLRNPDAELIEATNRQKDRVKELERELKLERERAKMRERDRDKDRNRKDDRNKDRNWSKDRKYDDDRRYKKKKRRKSFLSEIFDFDFD